MWTSERGASTQGMHTASPREQGLPTMDERQHCGRRKTYGKQRVVAYSSAMGWGNVLADVQRHGRVCPGWALGAPDGGGCEGLRPGRLCRSGAAVPGGAPPG